MGKILYLIALAIQPRSIGQLAEAAGVDAGHASRLCAELARAGWMRTTARGRTILPEPVMPDVLQEQRIERLSRMLGMAPQKGEFLMKCWLDLLVASDDLMDNARPGFLLNPLTKEPLEFDRYYLEGVAFEFNGRQHYGPTEAYPDEQVFRDQRARDLLKKGLSQEHRIVLVEVTSRDLSFDRMDRKIPDVLPRNIVDKGSLYAQTLARICKEYHAKVAR